MIIVIQRVGSGGGGDPMRQHLIEDHNVDPAMLEGKSSDELLEFHEEVVAFEDVISTQQARAHLN